MKKFYAFLALVGILSFSNCSKIEENNDPVLGTWANVLSSEETDSKSTVRSEWIFNDAYMGRFHVLENGTITAKHDFRWSVESGTYTISYPGTNKLNDVAIINQDSDGSDQLKRSNGSIMAVRE
ncbi:MAG: hypothetical protein AB3N16_07170 [Flavobacteriaceae bacterium]